MARKSDQMETRSARRSKGKSATTAQKKPKQTLSSRVDLVFPVARCNRMLKEGKYSTNVGKGAGIFLAAVL